MTSVSPLYNTFMTRRSQRGSMLDAIPLETGPRSVFNYMSEKDRERLRKGSQAEPSIKAPPTSAAAVTASPPGLPFTPPNIASAALRGFMPFTTDPVKQSRYIAYLRSQASPEFPELAPEPLPGQAADAFHKEMLDYAKSAAIFKPVSGAMATRFTSAAVVDMGPRTIEGLHQPVHTSAPALDANDREKERKEEELHIRREEVKRLKGLKMREMQEKLDKIGKEGGWKNTEGAS